MLGCEVSLDDLTPAQRSFVEERGVQRTVRGAHDGQVFLYWEGGLGTYRWLVDRDGVVLAVTRFTD